MDPNQFQQNFQMFMQQNPQFMMNNCPGMINNQCMMGMNNQNNIGNNNPGMMNMNNLDINTMKNMLRIWGFNEIMINNFINMFYQQNQQFQQPKNNIASLNLIFQNRINQNRIIIQANINESVASVINKYINKSGDYHINLYIFNGKKLNETLTLAESGITDNCHINVVELDELEGAHKIK